MADSNSLLNLPVGKHISIRALINGEYVVRSYTPTSPPETKGYFELIVKTYPNGNISKYLDGLKIGDSIEVKGPKGNFSYFPNMVENIGMIAGGTGLTPMLQVIRFILSNPADKTKISLVFANVSFEDILLKDELDKLAADHPKQLKVHYVLNIAPENWTQSIGFVTEDIIRKCCPSPGPKSKLLLCGPPPMIKALSEIAEKVGFDKPRTVSKPEDMVFKF